MGYQIVQIVGHLPTLLVLLTGLVLAVVRRDRLPGRARSLLVAGVVVLLVVELVGAAWTLAVPKLIDFDWAGGDGVRRFQLFSLVVSAVAWVGYAVGLGLVLGAVLTGRRPAGGPADTRAGWTPPPTDGNLPAGTGPAPTTARWGATDLPPPSPGQG